MHVSNTPRRTVYLALLAAWATLFSACAGPGTPRLAAPSTPVATQPAAAFPVTLTDGLGRQVRLEKAPLRIVSYQPSNTETLYAIGAGDRIVGTDNFSDFPEEAKAKPKLGGLQINLEALVALLPDLVVSVGRTPDFPTLLDPHKIPVLVLEYKDIPGTMSNVELLGRAVGRPVEASKFVADMRSRMGSVQARVRSAPKVRVYLEVDGTDPSRPFTVGPGSFIHDLIIMAGGANIAAGATGSFPRVSAEEIVKANPELIVVLVGPWAAPDYASSAYFAQRPGWGGIDAVRKHAVYGVDDDIFSRPGPRLVDALDVLARVIHPELFR